MTKNEKKELFVQAWKSVFGVDTVNDDDNFFEVGGDSIKGVQLVGWLTQKGLKLDMLKIYTAPTVEELVDALEETQPMAVPSELLTKDNVNRFMQDPVVQQAMSNMYQMPMPGQQAQPYMQPMGYGQPVQTCTPPAGYGQSMQLCMQPMCYGQPMQLCTPPMGYGQPMQLCTPPMGYGQPIQLCTPPMGYGQPMQLCMQPMGYGQPMQLCMQPMCYGQPMQLCTPSAGQPIQGGTHQPYMGFPVGAPISNPNVIQISEPQLGNVTRSPEDALDFVLTTILPNGYNKQDSLISQGMNSFNVMQLITRCAEQGYRLKIEEVIKDPTFSGIVSSMKTK